MRGHKVHGAVGLVQTCCSHESGLFSLHLAELVVLAIQPPGPASRLGEHLLALGVLQVLSHLLHTEDPEAIEGYRDYRHGQCQPHQRHEVDIWRVELARFVVKPPLACFEEPPCSLRIHARILCNEPLAVSVVRIQQQRHYGVYEEEDQQIAHRHRPLQRPAVRHILVGGIQTQPRVLNQHPVPEAIVPRAVAQLVWEQRIEEQVHSAHSLHVFDPLPLHVVLRLVPHDEQQQTCHEQTQQTAQGRQNDWVRLHVRQRGSLHESLSETSPHHREDCRVLLH
mmetsp:Transcript_24087/g.54079  ORF Transcript_24087/g.54079 Transcript_24087/m.54079 type:complete len:281 (-) Transcript_24087:163-1005(-)